jgi:NAD-dependent DNA ligase
MNDFAGSLIQHQVIAVTGVLDNLTRGQLIDRIKQAGGIYSPQVTPRTTLLIKGARPGQRKPKQATNYDTAIMEEDDFLKMIKAPRTGRLPGL